MKPFFRRMEERKIKAKRQRESAIRLEREVNDLMAKFEYNKRHLTMLARPAYRIVQNEEKRKTFLNYFFNRT